MRSLRSDQSSRAEVPVSLGIASSIDELAEALFGNDDSLRKLLWWCLRHLGTAATKEDAEDALQEFSDKRLPRVIATYRPGSQSLESYVYLCLKRLCWRRGRKLKEQRRRELSLTELAADGNGSRANTKVSSDEIAAARTQAVDSLVLQEDCATVRSLLSKLSPSDQKVISLHYEHELTAAEIASQLHLSEGAVEARLHRARRRLTTALNDLRGARP